MITEPWQWALSKTERWEVFMRRAEELRNQMLTLDHQGPQAGHMNRAEELIRFLQREVQRQG